MVYCTTAPTAAIAANEANTDPAVAGVTWRPAESSLLPDGRVIGSGCDKDWTKRHWLLEEVPV